MFAVTSTDMQKIKKTVDTLYSEKQKMEKEKSKKGGKGKGKASIRKIDDNVRKSHYIDVVMSIIQRIFFLFQ